MLSFLSRPPPEGYFRSLKTTGRGQSGRGPEGKRKEKKPPFTILHVVADMRIITGRWTSVIPRGGS